MRPIILTILIAFAFTTLGATEWEENPRERIEITQQDFPYLDIDTVIDNLIGVDYLAIVYPTAMRQLPGDHAGHAVRATVEYTALGDDYKTITFASYGSVPLPNYPILVGLCGTAADDLYSADLGYEIPATKEVIKKLKDNLRLISQPDRKICPETQ